MKLDIDPKKGEEYLEFQIKKQVTLLFVSFLADLQNIQKDRACFTDYELNLYRKSILDNGNNTIRKLNSEIEKFNVKLK